MRLAFLFLAACAPEAASLPDDLQAPPASVTLEGPDRLFVGRTNTFVVSGNLGQQEPVYLAISTTGTGRGPCPPALGGRCLGILAPTLLGQENFDGDSAEISVAVPSAAPAGMTVYLQAGVARGLGGNSSVLSNVISVETEDYLPGCTDPGANNYDPGATVDDGSCIIPTSNPPGSLLIAASAWTDPSPPAGWRQCAGFINSAGDDVAGHVLDNCLNTDRLRLRVWNDSGVLVDDVYATGMNVWTAWPDFNYLGGTPTVVQNTYWNGTTTFFTDQGGDACAFSGFNNGISLGNGNGNTLNISPSDFDNAKEIRINCNGIGLVGFKMALYE